MLDGPRDGHSRPRRQQGVVPSNDIVRRRFFLFFQFHIVGCCSRCCCRTRRDVEHVGRAKFLFKWNAVVGRLLFVTHFLSSSDCCCCFGENDSTANATTLPTSRNKLLNCCPIFLQCFFFFSNSYYFYYCVRLRRLCTLSRRGGLKHEAKPSVGVYISCEGRPCCLCHTIFCSPSLCLSIFDSLKPPRQRQDSRFLITSHRFVHTQLKNAGRQSHLACRTGSAPNEKRTTTESGCCCWPDLFLPRNQARNYSFLWVFLSSSDGLVG